MRKLPDGTYMYDQDPPGSNELAEKGLKTALHLIMVFVFLGIVFGLYKYGWFNSWDALVAKITEHKLKIIFYIAMFFLAEVMVRIVAVRKANNA